MDESDKRFKDFLASLELEKKDPSIIDDLGREIDSSVPDASNPYVTSKAPKNRLGSEERINAAQRKFSEDMIKSQTVAPVIMPEAKMEFDKKTLEGGRQNISNITGVETRPEADPREVQQQKTGTGRVEDAEYERAKKDILRRKDLGQPLFNPNRDTPEYKKAVKRFAEEQQALIDAAKVSKVSDLPSNVIPISGAKKAISTVAGKMLKKIPGAIGAIPAAVATGTAAYHLLKGDVEAASKVGEDNTITQGEYMKDRMFDSKLTPEELDIDQIKEDSRIRQQLKRKSLEDKYNQDSTREISADPMLVSQELDDNQLKEDILRRQQLKRNALDKLRNQ
jgi:hypothetical protein